METIDPDTKGLCLPRGFRAAGTACGIKASGQSDIALITTDHPATAVGVYTTNRVCAAPVVLDRQRTPMSNFRAVIANSGNANACTGEQGMLDAVAMTEFTARACGVSADEVLVMSTGIIGQHLEMTSVEKGIQSAADRLASTTDSLMDASRGILTTDTVEKIAFQTVQLGDDVVTITGIAKGSGMIAPNMATMLAVVMTDANLSPLVAEKLLKEVNDSTFNAISVDGHTSTNDTVLLIASGDAHESELADEEIPKFRSTLAAICQELALQIINDGEGATHLIEIKVSGCQSEQNAMCIARSVGASPLVKTAIAGADPNWGRIISAAGYAGPEFDPAGIRLRLNGVLLFEENTPAAFDADAVSVIMRSSRVVTVDLEFSEGQAEATHWTSDLTAEYVRINAEYHT